MTCPICNKQYAKTRSTALSIYVYSKRCRCRRPMKKVEAVVYDIRDCWRDEVGR